MPGGLPQTGEREPGMGDDETCVMGLAGSAAGTCVPWVPRGLASATVSVRV